MIGVGVRKPKPLHKKMEIPKPGGGAGFLTEAELLRNKNSQALSLDWFWDGGECAFDDNCFYKKGMEQHLENNKAKFREQLVQNERARQNWCGKRGNSVEDSSEDWDGSDDSDSDFPFTVISTSPCNAKRNTFQARRTKSQPNLRSARPAVNIKPPKYEPESLVVQNEILTWINFYLCSTFNRIEELCTGAAYCQFMHMLFPESISLQKVKFGATLEHEKIHNFRLVQAALQRKEVNKVIPVVKLVKGGYVDNAAFARWFRKFFDANYDGAPYNAVEARGGIALGGIKKPNRFGFCNSPTSTVSPPPTLTAVVPHVPVPAPKQNPPSPKTPPSSPHNSPAKAPPVRRICVHKEAEIRALHSQYLDNNRNIVELEKERDFYIEKLREIELYCQDDPHGGKTKTSSYLQTILSILYKTEGGFVIPQDTLDCRDLGHHGPGSNYDGDDSDYEDF